MSLKSCEKTGTNEVTLEIEIDAATFKAAVEKVYRKQNKDITIHGYRKGKAPRAIVEKIYGKGCFYEDAIDECLQDVYGAALDESKIDAVSSPRDFDVKSVSEEEGAVLTCKVTVKPEVTVGEYKGLKANYEAAPAVTAEDVDAEIAKKQEENARFVDVDSRPVEDGDITTIDYCGKKDGVEFEGGKAENSDLTIGSGQFIPGFEEQIIGHSIGETFDIDVTFPEDYGAADLAGAAVVFTITLKAIKKKELPEVDDEFVKDVSDFDTVAEYRADIEANMTKTREENAENAFKNAVIEQLADLVEGEIPEVMYDNAIEDRLNEFDYQLRSAYGMGLDQYLQMMNMSAKDFGAQYHDGAVKDVKIQLALEKIIELEGFEVSDEELEAEYKKIAEAYGLEVDKVKESLKEDTVKENVKKTKAIDLVCDSAKKVKPRKPRAKKADAEETKDESEADSEAPVEE